MKQNLKNNVLLFNYVEPSNEATKKVSTQSAHAQVVQLETGNHIVAFIVLKIIAN